ncbi:hypothetical protein ACN38_g2160 [Penicillium nordicum]|uniref:Uncharacterized protein n=1 Tax=Penicillium nordicum TaxID=229535 RepID=A0A0M8PFW3_9EURO|nr:hypothetical protein ACN38_g2160 [Penicillium nordicum]
MSRSDTAIVLELFVLLILTYFIEKESDLKTSTFSIESSFLLLCDWSGTFILLHPPRAYPSIALLIRNSSFFPLSPPHQKQNSSPSFPPLYPHQITSTRVERTGLLGSSGNWEQTRPTCPSYLRKSTPRFLSCSAP